MAVAIFDNAIGVTPRAVCTTAANALTFTLGQICAPPKNLRRTQLVTMFVARPFDDVPVFLVRLYRLSANGDRMEVHWISRWNMADFFNFALEVSPFCGKNSTGGY